MKKYLFFVFSLFVFNSYSQEKECVELSHNQGFYDSSFYLKLDVCKGILFYSFQNDVTKKSEVFPDSLLIDKTTSISFLHSVNNPVNKTSTPAPLLHDTL